MSEADLTALAAEADIYGFPLVFDLDALELGTIDAPEWRSPTTGRPTPPVPRPPVAGSGATTPTRPSTSGRPSACNQPRLAVLDGSYTLPPIRRLA